MKSLETLEVPFVGKNAKADAKFDQTLETEGKSVNMERTFSHFFGTTEYEKGRKMNNGYGDVYVPYTLRNVVVNATANVDYTVNGQKEGYAIGYNAFKDAKVLQSVTLKGENLKEIGENAFNGCVALKTITLPSSIKTVYEGAFSGCVQLTDVIVQGTNVVLQKNVFSGCSAMNKINSQDDISINLSCFSNIGENALDFTRQVEYSVIGASAFNLENILGTTSFKK